MADAPSLLSRLGRRWRQQPEPVVPTIAQDPDPARLSPSPTGSNPIHDLLDTLGLPWHEARSAVEQRLGIRPDPFYKWDVVVIDDATPLPGFIAPWTTSVSAYASPDLPITEFDGVCWTSPDTAANVQHAHDAIAQHLGPARIGQHFNTMVCEWRSGTASIGLIAWPPEWQSLPSNSDAHAAEPRLISACFVRVQTGFRLTPSAQEIGWLDDFLPVDIGAPIQAIPIDRIAETAAGANALAYVREPGAYLPRVHARIGYPADRAALIFCTDQLYVIPADDIVAFEVDRLLPAKGSGGSSLSVRCRAAGRGPASKRTHIASSGQPDRLNDAAHALAAAFGKPAEIQPYEYDA